MEAPLRISRRAADRLRSGHLWVYRSDVLTAGLSADLQAQETEPQIRPGALVSVVDPSGKSLGTGLYSTASQIAVRLVSGRPDLTREEYLADVRTRVREALARRGAIAPLESGTDTASDAQRLIFSEADGLPGIIADRYAEFAVVQLLTQGTAQPDVRAALVDALGMHLAPDGEPLTIWERPDPRIRELEQLPSPPDGPLFSSHEASTTTIFRLGGLRFRYDVSAGQKTGAFLDQRLNYVAAARWVGRSGRGGHAMDVCTYQGGFALHLAQVCSRVTGVDQSRTALEAADRNLALNAGLSAEVDWIEADAFEFLRALGEANRSTSAGARPGSKRVLSGMPTQFDAIVLDPPAFAKSKRAAEGAMRGYKEMNLRALRLLAPGGTLVTCSCSHHVSLEDFTAAVSEAAADAGRRVQLLETRSAAPDHPEVLTLPETRYLKCLICRVE